MSHLIDIETDTVYTPSGKYGETWHGLQVTLNGRIEPDGSNIPLVFCPIVQCGMRPDFEAEICDVPEDLRGELDLSGWKLLLADCRKGKSGKTHPLYIPKKGYQIHQNRVLFDTLIQSIEIVLGNSAEITGYEIATVGTLGSYSQFFVSISLKGGNTFTLGEGELHTVFYNLISSHNGLVSSSRMISAVRIVCMNTVQMSLDDSEGSGTNARIPHTKNSLELITPAVFARDLVLWNNQKSNYQKTLIALRAEKMTLDGFRAFATGVFTAEDSDDISVCSFNRVSELEVFFQRGKGNKGKTRYDALNAFTEYFTGGNGVGNPKRVTPTKRIASANFGRGNEWKLKALSMLSDEVEFPNTVKRGEILYTDRLAVESKKTTVN